MKIRLIELNDVDDCIKITDKDTASGMADSYATTMDSLAKMFGNNFHLGWIEASHDGIVYFSCNGGKWDFIVQLAGQKDYKVVTGGARDGAPMNIPWIYHVFRLVQDNISGGFRREGECVTISPGRILSLSMPVYSPSGFFPHISGYEGLSGTNVCWGAAAANTMVPSNLVNVTRSFVNTPFLSGHYTTFTKWKEYTETGVWPTGLRTLRLDQLMKDGRV